LTARYPTQTKNETVMTMKIQNAMLSAKVMIPSYESNTPNTFMASSARRKIRLRIATANRNFAAMIVLPRYV
jgi:hypothetical protein